MAFCCGCSGSTGCACAEGAPVGWKKLGPLCGFGPRPGFGGYGSNNNNNNNNNNSSNNSNNANNAMSSMLGNLLGMRNTGGACNMMPFGCGFPMGGGFCGGGMPFFDQCWNPCACGCDPCACGGFGGCGCPYPTGCRDAWYCTGATNGCCNGVCWKKFKIVSPNGREQCFPVAVPWWMCDATGTSGVTGSAEQADAELRETAQATGPAEAAGPQEIAPPASIGPTGCMSASQLLMQRYMIASPPRAFGKPRNERGYYAAEEPEAVPGAESGEGAAVSYTSLDGYQTPAVLIPSKETE